MGRLVRDPEIKYTTGENSKTVARYTLAVDRRFKRDGEPTADFIQNLKPNNTHRKRLRE